MPSNAQCCPNGRYCRAGTECVQGGCCDTGFVACDATDGSGYEGCMPPTSTCCPNGRSCRAGTYCQATGCCRDGATCAESGGSTGGVGTGVGGIADAPFTPNPNPRKAGLGGQPSKHVDLYWEAAYLGLWYEYQNGQCDPEQKPKTARGIRNTMSIEFEDDVAGFSVSVSLGDVGNVRVSSAGIEQNITILSTESVTNASRMDTCPISYKYAFPPGSTGNSMTLDYLHSDTGLEDRYEGQFYVHQVT
jgi:hypothetical protein